MKYLHVGWFLAASAIGLVGITGLTLVANHNDQQKHAWRGHWLYSHERFAEHFRCMRDNPDDMASCMRIAPMPEPPDQEK